MLDIEKMKELIRIKYKGNASSLANDIGITSSGLSRILNGNRKVGVVVLQKVVSYLKKHKMKVSDYIFL